MPIFVEIGSLRHDFWEEVENKKSLERQQIKDMNAKEIY